MKYHEVTNHYPSWATEGFGTIDFADYFEINLPDNPLYTVDYIARKSFSHNPWFMRILVQIREILVLPFGLKTGIKKQNIQTVYYEEGSVLVYFRVLKRDKDCIVLEEKDKHLNFRIIMQVRREELSENRIYSVSTLVHLNNLVGKIYFAVIRPFHYFIMKYTLKRLQGLENQADRFNLKVIGNQC